MEEKWKKVNPVLPLDYPDPDVIRVDDTYYMVSTTMHFMPGCVILRSYNLADWEIYSYVYETLELTDQECLKMKSRAFTMTARFCLMRDVPSLPTETARFM